MRCNRAMPTDLPSIEREEGWFYSDYRVEIETGELIYTPSKRNPRS